MPEPNFLERGKSKTLGHRTLAIFQWRRGIAPLLGIVAVVTVLFVMPPEMSSFLLAGLSRLPGGARAASGISWVASSLGLGPAGGEQGSLAALLAAMRAAKDARNAGWGAFFQGGALGSGNGDSLGMVRGSLADASAGDANLAGKVKGGDTISGIMTPKEAKESGNAVPLAPGDVGGQRERMARAGARVEGGQAYVDAGFLDVKGHAADPDMVRATLGTGAVPKAARGGTNVVRPAVGRNPAFTVGQAGQTTQTWRMGARGGVTLGQLVTARNAALMSSDPICGPNNGCPAEFAATTIGANYDGANLNQLGQSPAPNNPISGLAGSGSSPAMLSGPVSVDGASSPAIRIRMRPPRPGPARKIRCGRAIAARLWRFASRRGPFTGRISINRKGNCPSLRATSRGPAVIPATALLVPRYRTRSPAFAKDPSRTTSAASPRRANFPPDARPRLLRVTAGRSSRPPPATLGPRRPNPAAAAMSGATPAVYWAYKSWRRLNYLNSVKSIRHY